jgi:hypothetical protein
MMMIMVALKVITKQPSGSHHIHLSCSALRQRTQCKKITACKPCQLKSSNTGHTMVATCQVSKLDSDTGLQLQAAANPATFA